MSKKPIETIDVHELKNRWDASADLCVIDVREMDEWQVCHIPGAIHIPKDEISLRIQEIVLDKNQAIYLHCKGGIRSMYAAECLQNMGYTHVVSVDGGITAWIASGYPVEQ